MIAVNTDATQFGFRSTPVSDGELVNNAQRGDDSAFEELVRRYERAAQGIARQLLNNAHDAAEIVQDAFLRAYRRLNTLQDPERFRAWFLRIVTNLALNHRRDHAQRRRMRSLQPPGVDRELDVQATMEPDLAHALHEAERLAEVQAAIARLPVNQQIALSLFAIESVPQRDIAAMLGVSVEAVKWYVFQARRTLRRKLNMA